MSAICADLKCALSYISLLDLQRSGVRFLKTWNLKNETYVQDLVFITMQSPAMIQPFDEPMVASRHIPYEKVCDTRLIQEVSLPSGFIDCITTVVLRITRCLGLFTAARHRDVGDLAEEDLSLMSLLAPHIRRAITIGDLIDMKALEADALSATLDRLAMGVVVVAEENRILHANQVARDMLAANAPIAARMGRLLVSDRMANEALTEAIEIALRNEATIGEAGIGISIGSPADEPAVALVLPLGRGDVRTRLMPHATAAVFVTAPKTRTEFDFGVLARTHGLTTAEIRVCESLSCGLTLAEIAEQLGVSLATIKTHIARIFSKTGVSRQADLVALFERTMPPIRRARS